MKKELNEFSTGYPTSELANAQSQEYAGVFGPVDAEAVQGNDRLNPKTPEGLHRINVFLKHFFRRSTLNPSNEIGQLRARLNHMGLDFPFNAMQPVNPINRFKVGRTEVFGTTPTHDLSQGFDTGDDQPVYSLEIRVLKTDDGFKLDAEMTPYDAMEESVIRQKIQRHNRIESIREMVNNKKLIEDYEIRQINKAVSGRGEKAKKNTKDIEYRRRTR